MYSFNPSQTLWPLSLNENSLTGVFILDLMSFMQQSVPPVMAFHFGSLGFLSHFDITCYKEQIGHVLKGEFLWYFSWIIANSKNNGPGSLTFSFVEVHLFMSADLSVS